jgi:hypothetical protein
MEILRWVVCTMLDLPLTNKFKKIILLEMKS